MTFPRKRLVVMGTSRTYFLTSARLGFSTWTADDFPLAIDPDKRIYELGFQLRCECWRKGYGHEAAAAAIAYGFNVVGAHGLYAGRHPSNEASKHVLQGLGFRYTHDEFYPPTQQIEPCYLLTMAEFLLV
jgi:RimJ/RimL family protein N-acetyltransferase